MMKAAQLRQAILQAAVQGKLVPQNPHDEPASVLLERIHAEKARLVKAGKLRKEKPLPPITEDEILYDLPDNWEWYRLGELGDWGAGATPLRTDSRYYTNGTTSWLKTGELNDSIIYESQEKITDLALKECSLRLNKVGDVLIAMYGATIGKLAIVGSEMTTNQACCACTPFTGIYNWYLFFLLKAFKNILVEQGEGGAQPNISRIKIRNQVVPLPPFEEQQRIVAKVEELMAMCDELEAAEKELDALDEYFIEYLPKSILQAAVQGKLVPQNIHDEPASVLLERIHTEKAKLFKAGKLKKEKALPPITEDEIPYDIPDGWEWCRLGDIHTIHRGITFPAAVKGNEQTKGYVCCATTGSVQEAYNPRADVFVPEKYVKNQDQWLQNNDIIMSTANSRELVGKTCFWNGKERKTFGGFLTVIRACGDMSVKYSYYVLQYLWKTGAFVATSTQTTNIANINNSILVNTVIPLPPLAEQQRIVEKIDELMALCGELKTVEKAIDASGPKQATIIPLGKPKKNEPLQIAARGTASKKSDKHQKAIDDMFNDD